MNPIHQIPGYKLFGGEGITKDFVHDALAINSMERLIRFVIRWRPIWMLDNGRLDASRKIRRDIILGDFDWYYALDCIKSINRNIPCCNGLCHGGVLRLPDALIYASFASERFEVPFGTALHQSYCEDPVHHGCF